MSIKFSVIIPVFNTARFLLSTVNSVLNQTYSNIEIILVNDGSRDGSRNVISKLKIMNPEADIKVINIENSGQGYARNLAIGKATGEYILFLDSDDWIEKKTLELALERLLKDNSDIVHFDYKYYYNSSARTVYNAKETFSQFDILLNGSCDLLLSKNNYFTVTAVYKKDFLIKNNIYYGEGYLYEDFEFWTRAVNNAEVISLIHSPLYNVRVHGGSSTKTNWNTDIHKKSFLIAAEKSLSALNPRTENTSYYLFKYLLRKYFLYSRVRIPKNKANTFAKKFLNIVSNYVEINHVPVASDKVTDFLVRHEVIKKKKYLKFIAITKYYSSVKPFKRKIVKLLRTFKHRRKKPKTPVKTSVIAPGIKPNLVVFMGFDHRYEGNSKYLFNYFINDPRFDSFEFKFVSEDTAIPEKYRISPTPENYSKWIHAAEVIFLESWAPRALSKKPGSTWIQLWHGTPIKRMMFDSAESEIISKNPSHKIRLFNDTRRWNYLIADSEIAKTKFQTSMMINPDHILTTGYPRVNYLIENQNNIKEINAIKKKLGIAQDKKVILYAPTWRDYNYGLSEDKFDLSYLLNLETLSESLGDDYVLIFKAHHYLKNSMPFSANKLSILDASQEDTQELVLISDQVISDYSSIIFDVFPLKKPVHIYASDLEKYKESRGLYADIWSYLEPMVTSKVDDLSNRILRSQISEVPLELQYPIGGDNLAELMHIVISGGRDIGESA